MPITRSKNSYFIFTLLILALLPSICSPGIIMVLSKYETLIFSEGLPSMVVFFLVSIFTMAFAITPSALISLISGYFYGWMALPILIIAYSTASILGIKTGKYLQKIGIKPEEKNNKTLSNLLIHLNKHQFPFIFFSRLSRVLPFAMTNIALSTLSIKWKPYILATIIGMLPRTLAFFYAGTNAKNIWIFVENPDLPGFYKIARIALILISAWGLLRYLRIKH